MKKIALYIFLALGAAFISASCTNEFLDVDYYSIVSPDGVYEDADNVYQGLIGVYNALYVDNYAGCWPHPVLANQPSLDMQSEGWDIEMTTHSWGVEAKSGFFENLWKPSYKMISRANIFLSDLENNVKDEVVPPATKKVYEAEARALRAYCYYNLTTNFSRVPMLMTGETYATSPEKARPESDAEAWAAIVEDFEYAASVLDWKPANGEYGRFTKAAALAYAGKSNMYLGNYDKAKGQFKQIIESSGKSLNPVHGMLHWLDNPNSYESIWEVSFPEFDSMGWGWSAYSSLKIDARFSPSQNKAREYGGWGDSPVSYEFVRSFEPGDKRLMYNVVGWHEDYDEATGKMVGHGDVNYYYEMSTALTADLQNLIDGGYIKVNSEGGTDRWGRKLVNIYPTIGGTKAAYHEYFQATESNIPNNHSTKWWKNGDAFSSHSMQLYRYTGVLLDYAECCFRTGDAAEGWKVINQIRDRAWGNLEVGYDPNEHTNSKYTFPVSLLNTEKVPVPDAQQAYTEYKQKKGYTSDVWVVAVTQERRKEFLQEFSFWYDLTRMGLVEEWLKCEYPKNGGATFYNTQTGKYYIPVGGEKNQPYRDAPESEKRYMIPVTDRDWDWNPIHAVYPIPTSELTANPLCTQNEGY